MQGAEERRLRRMSNTPQGGAIEGNAADDALMVDQGLLFPLTTRCYRTTPDKSHANKNTMADLPWELENIETKPQSR